MRKVICLSFVIMASCQDYSQQENANLKKQTVYADGSIKSVVDLDKDSLEQGILKEYFPNGKLRSEVFYVNGKKSGIKKGYYETGKLKCIGFYRDDLQDSTWTWFFEDGTISQIDNWLNGKSFGENTTYNKDGSIKEYAFYTFDGEAIYLRKYNEDGIIIHEVGYPIQVIYNRNRLRENEKFDLVLLLGVIPYWKIDITIEEINGTVKKTIKKFNEDDLIKGVYNKKIIVENYFNDTGVYQWLININIEDNKYGSKINYKDTVEIKVDKLK